MERGFATLPVPEGAGGLDCSNGVFGDPLRGTGKKCFCAAPPEDSESSDEFEEEEDCDENFGNFDDTLMCMRGNDVSSIDNYSADDVDLSLDDCVLNCQVGSYISDHVGTMCCHYARSASGKAECVLHSSGDQRPTINEGTFEDKVSAWYASFTFEAGQLPCESIY